MKIRSVAAELFHAHGRRVTDMTKQMIAFRNFANAPKMAVCVFYLILHLKLFDEINFWALSLEMKYSANLKCELSSAT